VGTELSTRSTDAYNDHEFRVPHGRYGSMWYRDPLPGCDIAPADDTDRVSVSIVKKASGSDWSNVAIKRIAAVLEATPGRFAGLDATEIGAEMRKINAEGLKSAANRGTNVHTIAEQLLTGVPVTITADMPGGEYRGAVEAFFAQYDPTPVLMEFVCMNRTLNGHGFGGTADAIVEIKGKRYVIDWKSRGEDSRHGAYAQEAAQVGGYSLADYIVVDRQRRLIPELDGALIVSIKPDGYAVYPVDLPKAQAHFVDLHAWWVSRQTEHETYGRMWPKSKKAKDLAPSVPLAPVEQTSGSDPARSDPDENATTDSPRPWSARPPGRSPHRTRRSNSPTRSPTGADRSRRCSPPNGRQVSRPRARSARARRRGRPSSSCGPRRRSTRSSDRSPKPLEHPNRYARRPQRDTRGQ
jgi:hypothetical protein